MKPMDAQRKYLLLAYAVLFCAFMAIVFMLAFRQSGGQTSPTGMVRRTEIRIAPEVGGYVKDIRFKRGETVHAGDVIATLTSPELDAAVLQARKVLGQAEAARARVYAGVRYEEVETARQEIAKTKSNLDLAQAQYDRAKQLVRTGNISQQVLDDRSTQLATARSAVTVTVAALAKAEKGATDEDKAKVDRTVELAQAALDAIIAKQAKLILHAPVDATAWSIVSEPGEAVTIGQTVLTLEKDNGIWFVFNIREDRLGKITVGSILSLKTGDGKMTQATVTQLRSLGDFAVWRAESAISSHDLVTFEVRADLVGDEVRTLQSGMTAWIDRIE